MPSPAKALVLAVLVIGPSPGPMISLSATGHRIPAQDTEATLMTVTTVSDLSDGETASASALTSSPGSDGISLREALEVTNNDPGTYAVRFDATLAGQTILVGADTGLDLPPLLGGTVSIDGDVDADGTPDVMLRRGFEGESPCRECAFRISSSGNELQNLRVRGFATGVLFSPSNIADPALYPEDSLVTDQTYSGNEIAGLVMTGIRRDGVVIDWFSPECDSSLGEPPCETHNSWTDTRIVGNTIRSRRYGVRWPLGGRGDVTSGMTVSDNTIRISNSRADSLALRFEAGLAVGTTETRISDLTIARNDIGGYPSSSIFVASGVGASDHNVIDGVRIVDNKIGHADCLCASISLFLGESSESVGWDLDPIEYGDHNVMRDVLIRGNTIKGRIGGSASCCGTRDNKLKDIRIIENEIVTAGHTTGIAFDAGSDGRFHSRYSAGNSIVGLTVRSNRITIRPNGKGPPGSGSWGGLSATLQFGGVLLTGGAGTARDGSIRDVAIADNYIDTILIGISLVGGTYFVEVAPKENVISGVRIRNNRIPHAPEVPRYILRDARGISIVGGYNGARRNRVICIQLSGNRVGGLKGLLVVANAASGGRRAVGNIARLSCA